MEIFVLNYQNKKNSSFFVCIKKLLHFSFNILAFIFIIRIIKNDWSDGFFLTCKLLPARSSEKLDLLFLFAGIKGIMSAYFILRVFPVFSNSILFYFSNVSSAVYKWGRKSLQLFLLKQIEGVKKFRWKVIFVKAE